MSRNATIPHRRPRFQRRWLALGLVGAISSAVAVEPIAQPLAARTRVVIVQDPDATAAFQPQLPHVQAMVERGLTNLLKATSSRTAWLSLITTQDTVGIKVYSTPGPLSGTRPAVVEAIATSLMAAGLPAKQIIVWDKSETDLRDAGYFDLASRLGIRAAASSRAGWDETNYYDKPLIGALIYGDHEFERTGDGVGRKSFVSKLVSHEMTKIINVPPLLNHNEASVSGNLYSLALGSVDNSVRFENRGDRLAEAVPEIYALPVLADRVVLNIVDALVCQFEGGARGLLHYSTVLDQLRFSRDPVALDVLSIRELERQRRAGSGTFTKPNLELYRNAALLELGVAEPGKIQVDLLK